MEDKYEYERFTKMKNINEQCYIKIHPDVSEDIFRCHTCENIKLHKLNPIEYNNNNILNQIINLSIDDNRKLYF